MFDDKCVIVCSYFLDQLVLYKFIIGYIGMHKNGKTFNLDKYKVKVFYFEMAKVIYSLLNSEKHNFFSIF